MPESMIATPMPRPVVAPSSVMSPDHAASAPVVWVATAICERTVASAATESTSVSAASEASPDADAVSTAPVLSAFLIARP